MINPSNVVKILADRVSTLLSLTRPTNSATIDTTSSITNHERQVAEHLCDTLASIVNSHSYTFEVEETLDHGLADDGLISEAEDENEDEASFDSDYRDEEENKEDALRTNFSLDYMIRAVDFYDAKDPTTGKRKRRWSTVKHKFRRIPHQKYIDRFRNYLEKHGTKKQKHEKIDDYVFDMFERARENALPVHDNDLRRWALKKAMDESLHSFVAAHHWLCSFKHKHDIISRKVTK
ncbi:unnamed protein product, partial [Didymodactylos carnosus]